MLDHADFLRAIIDDRENDTPRLIYADWLDDHGEPERAEFIRVQCALIKCGCRGGAWSAIWHDCGAPRVVNGATVPACELLMRRESELFPLAFPSDAKYFAADSMGASCLDIPGRSNGSEMRTRLHFRRGFIDDVSCAAGDWTRIADKLTAEHPIEKVRLTRRPEVQVGEYGYGRLVGREKYFWIMKVTDGPGWDRRGDCEKIIAQEWPTIRFELPQLQWGPVRRTT